MCVNFAALASGSNGNCYYIADKNDAILVDVGVSAREVVKRMYALELDPAKVRAVFVSHEHTDHICGLQSFVKKFRVPVYITAATLSNSRLQLERSFVRHFSAADTVTIGDIHVQPVSKLHDAVDPYSFVVNAAGVQVGVFTDIGLPCEHVIRHFSQCEVIFLESNYDEEMLDKGAYPFYLKRRISGQHGHLSNRQALELFLKHRSPRLSHLVLSHLSRNNNDPALVNDLFTKHANGVSITVASRYAPTEVYRLEASKQKIEQVFTPQQMRFAF